MKNYEVVVIGGGPAGLAAAIEARKNGVQNILVIERDRELGGILQQCIHNGFGLHIFKEQLTGPEYAERFVDELKANGIEYMVNTMVLDIHENKEVHAINADDGYFVIQAKAVILAMGCRERTRGAITIAGSRPAGVFTAGAAQRYINIEGYMPGKKVFILGSGDIGLIMARRMMLEGAEVIGVAEVLPFSGGLKRNIAQCLDDFNIPLYLSHTVVEIKGKDRLEGIVVAEVDEKRKPIKGTEVYYDCDTLLLSVGLIPENELSRQAGLKIDRVTSGPVVNESMETSCPGIFACGNVVHVHDLVDFVTEESRRAGLNAARFVKGELKTDVKTVASKPGNGITYIVPHEIRVENIAEHLDLFMRVNNVYHNVRLALSTDGKVFKELKKPHLAPGEMEKLKLSKAELESLGNDLTIEIIKEGK